jgi:hypothetical protein
LSCSEGSALSTKGQRADYWSTKPSFTKNLSYVKCAGQLVTDGISSDCEIAPLYLQEPTQSRKRYDMPVGGVVTVEALLESRLHPFFQFDRYVNLWLSLLKSPFVAKNVEKLRHLYTCVENEIFSSSVADGHINKKAHFQRLI